MNITFSIVRTATEFRTVDFPIVLDPTAGDALTGTEKQVAWATKVRAEMLAILGQVLLTDLSTVQAKGGDAGVQKALDSVHPVLDHMLTITDAGWWLDRRHLGAHDLLKGGAMALRAAG